MYRTLSFSFSGLLLCSCLYGSAQTPVFQSPLPDSPGTLAMLATDAPTGTMESSPSNQSAPAQQTSTSAAPAEEQIRQTKRILGIIPNFRAVSTSQVLP